MTRRDEGIALLTVLWLLVLAGLVFTQVYEVAEREVTAEALYRGRAELSSATDGLLEQARLWLHDCNDPNPLPCLERKLNDAATSLPKELQVTVTLWDEGSKVNANTDTPEVLAALGIKDPEALQSLLDWRDADDYPRPQGAETNYYQQLPQPYRCRNGAISDLAELKLVKGLGEAPQSLLDALTVYGKLNPNTASIETFDAMLVNADVNSFVSQRVTNELIAYRERSPMPFATLTDVRSVLATLSESDWQRIRPTLALEPPLNINTASAAVVSAICTFLGLDSAQKEAILRRRSGGLRSLLEVEGLMNPAQYSAFGRYFGVRTNIVGIQLMAKESRTGATYRYEAIFEKQSKGWGTLATREL